MALTFLASLTTVEFPLRNFSILMDMKLRLDIETFVVFDYENRGNLINYLKREDGKRFSLPNIPLVIASQNISWLLKNNFSRNFLPLVLVQSRRGENEEILKILLAAMQR